MNVTIDTVCDLMTYSQGGSELDRLASVNDLALMMTQETCLDHTYKSEVASLQQTGWDTEAAAGGRQWTYQTCTEFGWYQSSDLPDGSWGDIIPVSLFENMCTDIFGPKFTLEMLEDAVQVKLSSKHTKCKF